jgi:hypothetical protein
MRKENEERIDRAIDRVEASIRGNEQAYTEAARKSRENTERYKEVRREVIIPAVTEFLQKLRSRNWKARCNPESIDGVDSRAESVVLVVSPPITSRRDSGGPLVVEFRLDKTDDAVACYEGPDRKRFADDTPNKRLALENVSWDTIEEFLSDAFEHYAR